MNLGQTLLLAVLLLAWAVWFGGLITIAVVTVSAGKVLEPATRVEFLRDLGERYLPVGAGALAVGLVGGLVLLVAHPWSVASTVTLVLGVALAVTLAVGVVQARRMTVMRQAAAARPESSEGTAVATEVRAGARRATALRGMLGVLTVAVFVAALVAAG